MLKKMAVLLVILALVVTACSPKPASPAADQGEKIAEDDFVLMNLSGDSVQLSSLKGEPVVIKVWASWCSICLAGMADYDVLSASQSGYKVLSMVAPDRNGEQSESEFKSWFSTLGLEHVEVLLDSDGEMTKRYGVRAFPTMVYIDAKGAVQDVIVGHMDNDQIIEKLESLK